MNKLINTKGSDKRIVLDKTNNELEDLHVKLYSCESDEKAVTVDNLIVTSEQTAERNHERMKHSWTNEQKIDIAKIM